MYITLNNVLCLHVAALQSVFPQTELGVFMALGKEEKESQLRELASIVTGIRLFNRDCGKGGEGIDDRKLFSVCTAVMLALASAGVYMYLHV